MWLTLLIPTRVLSEEESHNHYMSVFQTLSLFSHSPDIVMLGITETNSTPVSVHVIIDHLSVVDFHSHPLVLPSLLLTVGLLYCYLVSGVMSFCHLAR